MKDVYLIKASQAAPFVETLTRLGAPVEILSRAAGLPLDAVRKREGVIGERSLWRFIELAAEQEGLELLGYRTALDHPVNSAEELGGLQMLRAPTLKRLLEKFIEDVRGESTGTHYSLRSDGDHLWFHRRPIFRDSDASWQAEQYVISFIIQIIRLGAGPDWLPTRIRVCSLDSPGPLPAEWAPIEIEWGRHATEIRIGRSTLALPPRLSRSEANGGQGRSGDLEAPSLRIDDLVDRQIWSGEVGIDNAAHELGLSVTTLKRRLAEIDTSYSSLVEKRRYRWAKQLLSESELPIHKVARGLGYKHQSNFTRAFVRMSGVSPRDYRHTHAIQRS